MTYWAAFAAKNCVHVDCRYLSYRYCRCLILSYGKTCQSYRLNQLHKSIFCSEFEVKLLGNTLRVMIYTTLFVHVVTIYSLPSLPCIPNS